MKSLLDEELPQTHEPTVGVEVKVMRFRTTKGYVRFNCWDTGVKQSCPALGLGYYVEGQCAIIMFDINDWDTYDNVAKWRGDLFSVCRKIPIALCGNKHDPDQKVDKLTPHIKYFKISSMSNKFEVREPFIYLARELLRDPNLLFEPPNMDDIFWWFFMMADMYPEPVGPAVVALMDQYPLDDDFDFMRGRAVSRSKCAGFDELLTTCYLNN